MSKEYNIATIEAYLSNEMSGEERQAFEEQMANDEALQQEVSAYRQIFSGFRAMKEERFAGEVATWTAAARKENASRSNGDGDKFLVVNRGAIVRQMYRRVAIAAGFVVLLGAAITWWASRQYSDEQLIADVYTPPLLEATMGDQVPQAAKNVALLFEDAHRLFQQKNFTAAAAKFEETLQAVEADPGSLDNLTRKFYMDNSRWTLLLAKFAAGQMSEAKFLAALKPIADDPNNDYAEEAQSLLQDLGSFWRIFS